MDTKKVILKIVGIIVGIIAVCTVLAIFVGAPVMRNMQYKNAEKNAQNGHYIEAIRELSGRNMDDYKDVKERKQGYAISAALEYMEKGDRDGAVEMLEYAIEINTDKELTKQAKELLKILK